MPACDKALLDPPREGAIELVKSFEREPPVRIVYVACDPATLARAEANARANGLADRCSFVCANLFDAAACAALPACDKALLDPPREGAIELVKSFEAKPPSRIVYVACDPATLARDSGVLVNVLGYRLACAGVVNMFPHTSHVESIAVFER